MKILQTVEENENSAFFYTPSFYKNSKSFLFSNPVEIIHCFNPDEIISCLGEIQKFKNRGLHGYGIISYETGYALENKLIQFLPEKSTYPFIQFRFYEDSNVQIFDSNEIDFADAKQAIGKQNYKISNMQLSLSKDDYIKSIKKIKNYIADGDTYQVNFTIKSNFDFSGKVSDLFLNLIFNQSAEYTALINNYKNFVLSISPELFFSRKGLMLNTKPMKGTNKRGINLDDDLECMKNLELSEKNKAENVMIVDLLRNDFGRISEFGSVRVNSLFNIEKYESVYQMTSEIESKCKSENIADIVKNIFPCGSITGAPKIRTMEIISELENQPRNIYTGSIGLITPDKDVFNVAIRTLTLNKKSSKGEFGIGSGIVWDSIPEDEYDETLLKSHFLTKPDNYFELFETLLWEEGEFFLGKQHKNRIKNTADYFLFTFDEKRYESSLKGLSENFNPQKKYRVKISLDKWGVIKTEWEELIANDKPAKIILTKDKISTKNKFQYFKTTNREKYTRDYNNFSSKGFFDVIYLNEQGEITEGTITNIFIQMDKNWYTPPVDSGILNGCYREFLLNNQNDYSEMIITKELLLNADKIKLTNSLRKEIIVSELWLDDEKMISFS